jgi:tRNA nucleotidyltransferase (CCA-adding enzyme)
MIQKVSVQDFIAKTPKAVFDISDVLTNAGHQSFLVGGSIRDILLGLTPRDFDLATDATPDELIHLFPRSLEVGAKFGTVIVLASANGLGELSEEEEQYHVTTFRKDAKYVNNRWPESVEFSKTIEEDLSRRDFTINALALDMKKLQAYIDEKKDVSIDITQFVVDLFNGLQDLTDGIIRGVGDPKERILEDNQRVMRGCRLASQLTFTIEPETFAAISASASTITNMSMERIREDFVRILETATPSIGIELLRRSGILKEIIPELLEGVGVEQNEYHVDDVYNHLLRSCDVAPQRIRLAALLHDIGKPRTKQGPHFYTHDEVGAKMVEEIMTRMKFSKAETDHTAKLVRLHMFYYQSDWSDSAVRRFLAKVGDDETLQDLFMLRIAESTANPKNDYDPKLIQELEERIVKIRLAENALSVKDLNIHGEDIMALGLSQGPKVGEILNQLLEKVLDDPTLNDKETLGRLAKELIKE